MALSQAGRGQVELPQPQGQETGVQPSFAPTQRQQFREAITGCRITGDLTATTINAVINC